MTQFLDPQLATSKAARKQRVQTAKPNASSVAERAFVTFQNAVGREVKKADNEERLIGKAVADTMPDLFAALNEEARPALFFSLERVATPVNRRRIAKHPLRPAIVDEMHAEADEAEALAAEEAAKAAEAEAKAAEKAAEQAGGKDARPKGDAPDSATTAQ